MQPVTWRPDHLRQLVGKKISPGWTELCVYSELIKWKAHAPRNWTSIELFVFLPLWRSCGIHFSISSPLLVLEDGRQRSTPHRGWEKRVRGARDKSPHLCLISYFLPKTTHSHSIGLPSSQLLFLGEGPTQKSKDKLVVGRMISRWSRPPLPCVGKYPEQTLSS